eukprot:11666366-Ditylum_brightwellii.AAC.1
MGPNVTRSTRITAGLHGTSPLCIEGLCRMLFMTPAKTIFAKQWRKVLFHIFDQVFDLGAICNRLQGCQFDFDVNSVKQL